MIGQVVLTVSEAKLVIAKAIATLPEVRRALLEGKLGLKGGTTVSALSELLGFPAMHISGRITTDGARGSKSMTEAPHCIIAERGQWRAVRESLGDGGRRDGAE